MARVGPYRVKPCEVVPEVEGSVVEWTLTARIDAAQQLTAGMSVSLPTSPRDFAHDDSVHFVTTPDKPGVRTPTARNDADADAEEQYTIISANSTPRSLPQDDTDTVHLLKAPDMPLMQQPGGARELCLTKYRHSAAVRAVRFEWIPSLPVRVESANQ